MRRLWATAICLSVGLSIGLGLSGCASVHKPPPSSAPHATLLLERGDRPGGPRATWQELSIAEEQCAPLKRMAIFTSLTAPKKTTRVPAGSRRYFRAGTLYMRPAGTVMNYHECSLAVSFVPQAGERYRIIQHTELSTLCVLEVTSLATGLPPPDLEPVEPGSCAQEAEATKAGEPG